MATLIPSAIEIIDGEKRCFDSDGHAGWVFRQGVGGSDLEIVGEQDFVYRTFPEAWRDNGDRVFWWRQMMYVPDGISAEQDTLFAINTACGDKTLRFDIQGLIETTNAGYDRLEIRRLDTNTILPWTGVRHTNRNCVDDETQQNIREFRDQPRIESIGWESECSVGSPDDNGDIIMAAQTVTVYQAVCPTIFQIKTDTRDARNNVGGQVFYDITLTIS